MLLQGILLGFSLSFLVGPLLFAIVEAGISQGFRAGVAVAAGIWVSDVLYVLAALFGVGAMEALVALPNFKMWAGLSGGLVLVGFGAGSLWKVRSGGFEIPDPDSFGTQLSGSFVPRQKSYLWWWLRGFLLNTINPGTVFFWFGIISAVVVPSGWNRSEMLIFFAGMLATLVVTDTLKAWAAKALRSFLTPTHTRQIQRSIGALMMVFGLALFFRAIIS